MFGGRPDRARRPSGGRVAGTGLLGPWRSRRTISLAVVVAIAYAAFDESTQAVPFIRRYAAWDDFAFNVVGILAVGAGAYGLSRYLGRTGRGRGKGRDATVGAARCGDNGADGPMN